jgi:hypothetical protein
MQWNLRPVLRSMIDADNLQVLILNPKTTI